MPLNREEVMSALRTVQDPELFKDIVTLNLVKDVKIAGGQVDVVVELTSPRGPLKDVIERDVTAALRRAGAESVKLHLTAPATASARGGAAAGPAGGHGPGAPRADILPQVKHIIAVGAGKGGVGKSTVAVNLAVGLQRLGHQVGLMDGDVYGPSMPTMLGIKGRPPMVRGPKLLPFHVHGLFAVTIGALVEQDKPLIWRGPMAQGAFRQLLADNTEWPDLDYLIVDLPPGTGDVPLTLCQLLPLSGAVVVATPQQVALDDAVRAIHMFQQLGAPILGLVENMSYLEDTSGTIIDIFGRGGAEKAAQAMGLPFLGALPIHPELRVNSDAGTPIANFTGNPRLAGELENIVRNLVGQINLRNARGSGPQLNIL